MEATKAAIAASFLMASAFVSISDSGAQGAQFVGHLATVNSEVPLTDAQGTVRAKLQIRGTTVSIVAPNGLPLNLAQNGRSLDRIENLQLPDAADKADAADQRSIETLQKQIDALAMKVIELTNRVNELSP